MSILWEEEGPKEVFVQGSGSLIVAVCAYFVMSDTFVSHIAVNFPELLLVVLALIIMIVITSYSIHYTKLYESFFLLHRIFSGADSVT